MNRQYDALFKTLDLAPLPEMLKGRIMAEVRQKEKALESRRAFSFAFGTLVSFSALLSVGMSLMDSFAHSGFYNFVSLVFSGDSSVLAYWKELSYSLVESLPVVGVSAFLLAAGFFVWTSANAMTSAKRSYLLAH